MSVARPMVGIWVRGTSGVVAPGYARPDGRGFHRASVVWNDVDYVSVSFRIAAADAVSYAGSRSWGEIISYVDQ